MNLRVILLILSALNLFAHEAPIDNLLNKYQSESDLSNQTKRESSGILYLYTREELEKMQVKNLQDVLKTIPGFNLYKNRYNFPIISLASNQTIPMTAIRIFINDHDMSSVAFGSAFLLWGAMNIEYIDHIEVYKSTSSVEFGDETASIIIKLYTKRAGREEGSKLRTMADEKGSSIVNFYTAKTVNDDFSYFAYAETSTIKKKTYHKEFKSQNYDLKSDLKDYNIYSNFIYKDWFFELGMIAKDMDSFLGLGKEATPANGGNNLVAQQEYIHVTKKFNNGIKLQLSVDDMDYTQSLIDLNGIDIHGLVQAATNYLISFNEKIYSVTVEKKFKSSKNSLFVGGFYKYKSLEENGVLSTLHNSSNRYEGNYENSINYSSLYAEDEFKLTQKISLIGQIKYDINEYEKDVRMLKEITYKTGVKYKDKHLLMQLLYTHLYLPIALYQYYTINRVPYSANNKLEIPKIGMYLFSSKYKFDDSFIKLALGKHIINNPNLLMDKKTEYTLAELSYNKAFNRTNSFEVTFYDSYNYSSKLYSPKYGVNLQLFNKYKNIDIYNELVCKSSYDSYNGIKIENSVDWTSAVKYHKSKDVSIGLRGENLLDKGLTQAYQPLSYSVPVVERKIWLNLEYLF